MFQDLFESAQKDSDLQLNSAFDVQEFSGYIGEAESTINTLIDQYRSVMNEALQESANQINDDVILVMEQANEHVGNKIVAALKKLWDWIVKIVDSAINFLSTMITSNKKFIEKIKPEVEKKNLSAADMDKIRMSSYDYKPELITIESVNQILSDIEGEARSEYNAQNKEQLDKIVEQHRENKKESVSYEKIVLANKMVKTTIGEAKDWGKYKDELRLKMMGEKKVVKSFSMDYFKVIENYSNNANAIKSTMEKTKGEFKKIIDKIAQQAKDAKKEGKAEGGDAKFASGKVAFLNYLRAKVSAAADAFAELLHIKLSILKRQLSDARQFCMHAARYKPLKEGAIVIPFDPIFENADADVDDDDGMLGEGTFGFTF